MKEIWDCIVVGGGAAGLSAGLVLGRARRDALVIDAGQQSNLTAAGIGGLLGTTAARPVSCTRSAAVSSPPTGCRSTPPRWPTWTA